MQVRCKQAEMVQGPPWCGAQAISGKDRIRNHGHIIILVSALGAHARRLQTQCMSEYRLLAGIGCRAVGGR